MTGLPELTYFFSGFDAGSRVGRGARTGVAGFCGAGLEAVGFFGAAAGAGLVSAGLAAALGAGAVAGFGAGAGVAVGSGF